MNKFQKVIMKIGSILLNPIKLISGLNIPEKFLGFVNKHVWFKVLFSLVVTVIVILVWYLTKENGN
ncbi:MAG: hypothetical protein GX931_00370 [Acholeplasmataceae bacterium]|jgi:hypothetical protein|nr:hypothetical protein [Acholeplasmataceae bacterium]